jgi:hypothetical protein
VGRSGVVVHRARPRQAPVFPRADQTSVALHLANPVASDPVGRVGAAVRAGVAIRASRTTHRAVRAQSSMVIAVLLPRKRVDKLCILISAGRAMILRSRIIPLRPQLTRGFRGAIRNASRSGARGNFSLMESEVDVTLIQAMLALTPQQRIEQNDRVLRMIEELRDGLAKSRKPARDPSVERR